MKKICTLIFLIILTRLNLEAGNLPTIGNISKTQVNVTAGSNFLLVNGITDGDGSSQISKVNISSSDLTILSVDSISYTSGNNYAFAKVTEKGIKGAVTLTVEVTDADGVKSKTFTITVDDYLAHGVKWKLYDIVFYEHRDAVYLDPRTPLLDTILPEINMPLDPAIYEKLPLTVGPSNNPPQPKNSFFTDLFKGYLIPPLTGVYTFYTNTTFNHLYLSKDDKFENAILTETPNQNQIDVSLIAGQKYALYMVNYTIYTQSTILEWSGPSLPGRIVIGGNYIFPSIDLEKPTIPTNLSFIFKGIDMAGIKWNKSTDNERFKGYNIYVNGEKALSTKDTFSIIPNLTANTAYSIFVTAYDGNGNESFPSNVVAFTSYNANDTQKPSPPTDIHALQIFDVSAQIIWSGATDKETEVYAYKVYVNGVLYNTIPTLLSNIVIKNLIPETSYSVQIEAIDVAQNVSDKSSPFIFKTTKFDPLTAAPGMKKARLNMNTQPTARNEGFGINGRRYESNYYTGAQKDALIELKPAAQRWVDGGKIDGGVDIPASFNKSIGATKEFTYAKFMNYCNELGSYTAITTGITDASDFNNTDTFRKLIEYLNGPSSSTYGAIRAKEGFAEPLLKNSRGLIIEFGNEVWAGQDNSIGSDYTAYALYCREAGRVIRSSPYYDPTKIFLSYSGRNPDPVNSFGLNDKALDGDTGEVDWLSVSGYLGGNLVQHDEEPKGTSELEYYKSALHYMATNITGTQNQIRASYAKTGRYVPTYLYESNTTDPDYNRRLGQAIIETDYLLTLNQYGMAMGNIFDLTDGQWRITDPSQNYKRLPLFYTAKLVNTHTIGNRLSSDLQIIDKIPGTKIEALGAHIYSDKGKYAVVLLSRDFENDYQVQVSLPDGISYHNAKKYVLSGKDFSAIDVVIDSSNVTLSDSMIVNVPMYSMVLFTFDGPDLAQKKVSLGYTKYLKMTSLIMTAENGTSIDEGGKTIIFSDKVAPTSTLNKHVKWEVINSAGIPLTTSLLSTGKYSVQGSNTCAGNGNIILKVMAEDDSTVFDQKTINISNQCPLGTSHAIEISISMYPNPVKNVFMIESSLDNIIEIHISNLLGETLENIKTDNSAVSIDLGKYPTGIYVIEVETSAGQIRKKIIKQ